MDEDEGANGGTGDNPLPWREGNLRGGGNSSHCEKRSDEAILWEVDLGSWVLD